MTSTAERNSSGPEQPWWDAPDVPAGLRPAYGPVPPAYGPVPTGHGPVPAGYGPAGWPAAPRTGPRRGWVVLGLVGAVLAVALLGSALSAKGTMDVTGTVSVTSTYPTLGPFTACEGRGLYSWLHDGTRVTVRDADGAVVGTGSLGVGVSGAATGYYGLSDTCTFSFTVDAVPARGDTFRIAVGTADGTGVLFSRTELENGGAHLTY
ncbi:hypothetical protein [Pseudonocardia spirodelae]|uniref:Uncharacterized protein n=1 Tax=Pseudonocardia spirodelae TaxID=3133431 RepID=A0ABU8TCT5_9PSEU